MTTESPNNEEVAAAIARGYEFLMSNETALKELYVALLMYKGNAAQFSFFVKGQVNFIKTVLQELNSATENPIASLQQVAPDSAIAPEKTSDIPRLAKDATSPTSSRRSKPSVSLDLALLSALHVGAKRTQNVGLDALFKVTQELDPARSKASLTSKLNRWKSGDGIQRVDWLTSNKMRLTSAGYELLKEKIADCAPTELEKVATCLRTLLGDAPDFEQMLTAR